MKIPFDIKYKQDILDGKVKVVTRDGRPAEILKWDAKSKKYPIIGTIDTGEREAPYCWTLQGGVLYEGENSNHDLFILTPDPDFTEFEKAVEATMTLGYSDDETPFKPEEVKQQAKLLLELAKKEVMKDLPKWKKTWNHRGKTFYDDKIYIDDYCIDINELFDRLPKEE